MTDHRTIEDTVYFWFGANDTSGSGNDGASPAAHVRLAGAAGGAAPVLSPTPTLLSHATFPAGSYEVAIAATVANGFAAGNEYAVFCTLLVDSQNPNGLAGSFILAPIIANVKEVSDDSTAADSLELACDNYSVTRGLTGTALPAAVADAAGGVPISDTGGLDLDTQLANTNEVTAARMGALTDWINGGRLDLILDIIAADVVNLDGDAMRGTNSAALAATALTDATWTDARAGYLDELAAANLPTDIADIPTVTEFNARTIESADYFDPVNDAVANVTLVATTTTNTDMVTEPPTAVQNRQEMDSNSTELAKIGTIPALDGGAQTIGAAIAKLADDNAGADFDAGTDSLQEIRDRGDAAWITGAGGDATEAKQDTIIADVTGLNGDVMRGTDNAATAADVLTQATAALVAIHLDHLIAVTYDPDSKPGVATALWNELIESNGGVSRFTAAALANASGTGASAAQIWAYATRTLTMAAAAVAAMVSGDTITVKRGDSWSIAITGLGDISSRTKLWVTVKRSQGLTDAEAIIQIEETAGLIYLNGAAASTAAWGDITIDNAGDGDITITLDEAATVGLSIASAMPYDIQMLAGGDVTTLSSGSFVIVADVTRAIT